MAVNKIPESELPVRSVLGTDYVRIVGADGKSYRVPKTDFNGGGGGGTIDPALSPTSTNAVQNKAIYNALSGLNSDLGNLSNLQTTAKTNLVAAVNEVAQGGGGALTQDIKQALLQLAEKVAYVDDDGQDYYDDLEDALYPFDLLSSISAVYTQSGTVYDTDSLDSLKSDLIVTGNYSDSTTNTIRNYTLSGTLAVGTSTITVTYGGKTATFTVTVTQSVAVLTSITCVYTQSGTVYDTDTLDSLKTDLVVTAHYSDSTTETVASADYTLSGTLTEGTSTITVSYEGETTTFNVTVSHGVAPLYDWDLKTSLTDIKQSVVASTSGTLTENVGVIFSSGNKYIDYGAVFSRGRTYELDVYEFGTAVGTSHRRLIAFDTDANTAQGGAALVYRTNTGWSFYTGSAWDATVLSNTSGQNMFDGKTVQLYLDSDGYATIKYKTIGADDSTYITLGTSTSPLKDYTNGHVYNGGSNNDSLGNITISGFRIYGGEK